MAVSGGEMEALTAVKWPMVVWRCERERERESESERAWIRKKKKGAYVLTFNVKITNGVSVSNELMKWFISLIQLVKVNETSRFINEQLSTDNPSVIWKIEKMVAGNPNFKYR